MKKIIVGLVLCAVFIGLHYYVNTELPESIDEKTLLTNPQLLQLLLRVNENNRQANTLLLEVLAEAGILDIEVNEETGAPYITKINKVVTE